MPRFVRVILLGISIGVVTNAALIIYSSLYDAFAPSSLPHPLSHSSVNDCCAELCRRQRELSRPTKVLNYTEIANKMPHLDPSYHDTTMVKLGSDLNFDSRHCPLGSNMQKRTPNFTPEHLDCPTLFLVGARKGGTSSLYHYISQHPDFGGTKMDAGSKVGETFYFSRFYKVRSWERYISLFPGGGVMTGDSSVGNLVQSLAPKRLYEACGKQAKVVMLFRDPIKRLESNFLMRSRLHKARVKNQTSISTCLKIELDNYFEEVFKRTLNVKNLPKEWSKLIGLFHPARNMVFEGLYYVHLLNWLCNFPAENILIINSEEFFEKPSTILDIVFQFLGLRRLDTATYDWITSATYNRGSYNVPAYQKLTRTDIMNLLGVYKPFNRVLLELLQWENHQWLMN